jgi:hypothetical protein
MAAPATGEVKATTNSENSGTPRLTINQAGESPSTTTETASP